MTTNTADRWTILAKSIFSLRLDFTNKRKPKLMKWKGENKSELMQKGQRKSKEPKHINCYPQTAQTVPFSSPPPLVWTSPGRPSAWWALPPSPSGPSSSPPASSWTLHCNIESGMIMHTVDLFLCPSTTFSVLYFLQVYCPSGISPMGNLGCLPRGKPAARELHYPA